jgi:hypothetical protein
MEGALLVGKWIVKALGGYRATAFLLLACAFLASSSWYKHEALRLKQERDKAVVASMLADARLKVAQAKVTERVVTKYVDRVKVVAGRTQTIIKEVPIYVPADSPNLPAGFRVLHDAAAQGVIPDPARIADAAPVPAQDAAETIAGNYGVCWETAEQVRALQDWIREQQAVSR